MKVLALVLVVCVAVSGQQDEFDDQEFEFDIPEGVWSVGDAVKKHSLLSGDEGGEKEAAAEEEQEDEEEDGLANGDGMEVEVSAVLVSLGWYTSLTPFEGRGRRIRCNR